VSGALRVALGEYDTGWHDPATSLARAERVVRDATAAGAALVVLPEMCTTGFTMDAATYAEPLEGASVRELRRVAREAGVSLVAGVALRECIAPGKGERAVNAALVIGKDGAVHALYRKQRVFAYAGEDETYAAGTEPVIVSVDGVRIAPFVCYDLRFPELFRRVAAGVDAIVVIANWPAVRRTHWDTLIRARAIENQCYVVAVNRTGEGGGLSYDGGSAAFDPWGDPMITSSSDLRCVELDPRRVRAVREQYPFLRDHQR
jgi:omega-amidase